MSYDGKPLNVFSGEREKFFSVMNSSLSDEQITISVAPMVNVSSNEVYVSKFSAVPWLIVSSENFTVGSGERSVFSVVIDPSVDFLNYEYYANIKVYGHYEERSYPLVVKAKEPGLDELNPTMSVKYREVGSGKSIFIKNVNEVHQLLDVFLRFIGPFDKLEKEEYVYRNKVLLPGESLEYKVSSSSIDTIYEEVNCVVKLNHKKIKEFSLK